MKRCSRCGKHVAKRIKVGEAWVCKPCSDELSQENYNKVANLIMRPNHKENYDVILIRYPDDDEIMAYVLDNDEKEAELLKKYRRKLRAEGQSIKTKKKTYKGYEMPYLAGKHLCLYEGEVVLEMQIEYPELLKESSVRRKSEEPETAVSIDDIINTKEVTLGYLENMVLRMTDLTEREVKLINRIIKLIRKKAK